MPHLRPAPQAVLLLATLLVAAMAMGRPAGAQGTLGALTSTDVGQVLVEREEVRRRALDSFRDRVERGRAEAPEPLDASGLEPLVENFAQDLEQALTKLEGDGVLFAAEVSQELGELRATYDDELESFLAAARHGVEAPPLRNDYDRPWTYAAELAGYTLTQRNAWFAWGGLLAFLLGGVLIAWSLNRGARALSRRLAEGDRNAAATAMESATGPLYLSAITVGFLLGLQRLWLPAVVADPAVTAAQVALVAALFWLFWNLTPAGGALVGRFVAKSYGHELTAHAARTLDRFLRVVVLAGLAVVVVQVILETSLPELFTGLGIAGLALYFVFRGTLENLAASFTILGDKLFEVGDLITWHGEWGNVELIGFRSTRLRTLKGHVITIPNRDLIDESVNNVEERPSIRRRFRLGIAYRTPPEKIREAREILLDILGDHDGMPEDSPPKVEFEEFGESTLNFFVQYYYEPPDFYEAMAFDTEVNLAICERFAEAGIEIAFPTETHVLTTPEDGPPPRIEVLGAADAGDDDGEADGSD